MPYFDPAGPVAVVVAGLPGVGKSTVARLLAHRLLSAGRPVALLDQDTLTGPLTAVVGVQAGAGLHALDHPLVRELTRGPRYEALLATASDILATGVGCLLVAPFTTERDDQAAWSRLVDRLHAAGAALVLLVYVAADPGIVLERLRTRGAPRDDGRLADPHALLASLSAGAGHPIAVPHIVVDSGAAVEQQLDDLVRTLAHDNVADAVRPCAACGGTAGGSPS